MFIPIRSTLSRMLKNEGIKSWIGKGRPLLTAEVVAKHKAWCKKYRN